MDSNVCVIIAAYNAEATIARAVRSALAEREAVEVIVVDDASSDNTINIARSFDDGTGRLKILTQPSNTGPASARNRALAESRSSWIAILDADDFFLPGRIQGLLAHANGMDFIADDLWKVNENADEQHRSFLGITKPKTVSFSEFVQSNIPKPGRSEMGFLKPLMRRQFLDEHNIRYQEQLRLGEDYELYARALGSGAKFLLTPAQGYVAVTRQNSLSNRHSAMDLLHFRDCDKALLADLKLTKPERKILRAHYTSVDCRLQWRLLISAVKNKNAIAAFRTFLRPFPVPVYLIRQLWRKIC